MKAIDLLNLTTKERAEMQSALARLIGWSRTATWICLCGMAMSLAAFGYQYAATGIFSMASAVWLVITGGAAWFSDYAYRACSFAWVMVCPCPACEKTQAQYRKWYDERASK